MKSVSYKLKLNTDQLNVLWTTVGGASACVMNYNTMEEKLLLVNLICIAKKLNAKWFMPSKLNTITLTASETIAFWLLFNGKNYSNDYQMAVMRNILDDIHKKFI